MRKSFKPTSLLLITVSAMVLGSSGECIRNVHATGADPVSHKETPMHSPIKEETFTVVASDGIKLAGTTTVVPHPRAVLIPVHGSFVQTRDGDLDGTKTWMFPHGTPKRRLFADIAEILAGIEVATVRFDKRASGESGGIYEDTDLERLAQDVVDIAGYARKRFPGVPVGYIGQSEGGQTVIRAAQIASPPDLLILQGPSLEPLEVFLEHQKTRAAVKFLAGQFETDYPYLTAFYRAIYEGDMLQRIVETKDTHYTLQLGKWSAVTSLEKYRQYRWNAKEMLRSVHCPTGVVYGALDANVRPEAGRQIIQEQISSGAYPNVKVTILDGLEHSFRRPQPDDTFMSVMGRPLDSAYRDWLIQFVNSTLDSPPAPTNTP